MPRLTSFAFISAELPDSEPFFEDLSGIIEDDIISQTKSRVAFGRTETESRIKPHLDDMSTYLDGFESDGDP